MAVVEEGSTADEFAAMATVAAAAAAAQLAAQPVASTAAPAAAPRAAVRRPDARQAGGAAGGEVLYAKGPVAGIPEQYASRKERFAELDTLQPDWTVELRSRGETVDAVFYTPSGEKVGAYAAARRMALQYHKSVSG